jgi:hypothetical protein
MDIIARLYHEFSPRDDFILKIVGSLQDASDDSKNYLVTGGKNYVIILDIIISLCTWKYLNTIWIPEQQRFLSYMSF